MAHRKTKRPRRFTVRIQQVTGGWRNVAYGHTLTEAKETARMHQRGGYFAAVFEGNRKIWEAR